MNFTFSVGNMLGAVILLCAFCHLTQRRLPAMLKLNQIAALALGASALWQGFVEHAWPLYGVSILVLAVQMLVLPRALGWMIRFLDPRIDAGKALPAAWAMLVGLLPVILAALAVLPVAKEPLPPISGSVAMALGILLLGLWLMVVNSRPLAQIIGFITLANGLILGLINAPGLGWMVDVAVMAILGMEACLILLAYWRYRAPEETKTDGAGL